MEKITIWNEVVDAGDGSAYVLWHLNEPEWHESQLSEPEEVETFVGSNIHLEAQTKNCGCHPEESCEECE